MEFKNLQAYIPPTSDTVQHCFDSSQNTKQLYAQVGYLGLLFLCSTCNGILYLFSGVTRPVTAILTFTPPSEVTAQLKEDFKSAGLSFYFSIALVQITIRSILTFTSPFVSIPSIPAPPIPTPPVGSGTNGHSNFTETQVDRGLDTEDTFSGNESGEETDDASSSAEFTQNGERGENTGSFTLNHNHNTSEVTSFDQPTSAIEEFTAIQLNTSHVGQENAFFQSEFEEEEQEEISLKTHERLDDIQDSTSKKSSLEETHNMPGSPVHTGLDVPVPSPPITDRGLDTSPPKLESQTHWGKKVTFNISDGEEKRLQEKIGIRKIPPSRQLILWNKGTPEVIKKIPRSVQPSSVSDGKMEEATQLTQEANNPLAQAFMTLSQIQKIQEVPLLPPLKLEELNVVSNGQIFTVSHQLAVRRKKTHPREEREAQSSVQNGSNSTWSLQGILNKASDWVGNTITGHDHISKDMKYRHAMLHLFHFIRTEDEVKSWTELNKKLKSYDACKEVYNIIVEDSLHFENGREHYQKFVYALRSAIAKAIDQKEEQTLAWLRKIAYQRFTGLELYSYCEELVLDAIDSQEGFKKELTLSNFYSLLLEYNEKITNLDSKRGSTSLVKIKEQAKAGLNVELDPLSGSNVPYIYGYFKSSGGRLISILRHGIPFALPPILELASEKFQKGFQNWMASHAEKSKQNIEDEKKVLQPTADYLEFIVQSRQKDKNILHLCFESSLVKIVADESIHVKGRLELGKNHSNFYPVAFPMDGSFFHPHDYQSVEMETFKNTFLENLVSPLERNGFHFDSKILPSQNENEAQFQEVKHQLKNCMERVEERYFKGEKELKDLSQYQAFILLTYCEITHWLCDKYNISILEAFCKDDIDRGGAFKAIFTLDLLYRTNQLNSEKLEELMVNIIAAPLIVKKQAILKGRCNLIGHVIEILKKAPPVKHKEDLSFEVMRQGFQSIYPEGATCQNSQEYQDFILDCHNYPDPRVTTFKENYLELVNKNLSLEMDSIKNQIKKELERLYVELNGVLLNPNKIMSDSEKDSCVQKIIEALKDAGFKDRELNGALNTFHQAVIAPLTEFFLNLLHKGEIGYTALQDAKLMTHDIHSKIAVWIDNKSQTLAFRVLMLIFIVDSNLKPMLRFRVLLEVPNHKASYYQVKIYPLKEEEKKA